MYMSRLNKTANPQDSMKYHQRNAAETHLIGGIRIALVLLGVMIALPAFMMGASISRALGVMGGIQASLIGGLVLALVALPAAIAGAQSRKNSYQLIQQAFGERGGLLVNVVVVIAILGWFGVIAMMFGRAFQPTLPTTLATIPVNWLAFFGCTLMTLLTIFGFRALDLLSVLASPFKIVVLLWTLVAALASVKWSTVLDTVPTHDFSMTTGISMVVGGIMTGAMLAPDISRFARTPKQAAFACALAYGVGFPLVLILSGIPSVATGQMDIVTIMLSLGLGIPAMIAVLLIALTTNAYNLYASTLILSTLTPLRPKWQLALAAAGVGTTAGLMGISEGFVPYLILLSISIPPIAGVYLTNYYLGARLTLTGEVAQWRTEAFLAWIAGSGFAYTANHIHFVVTSIPPLDSLLVSSLTYVCLRYLMARAQVARLERQDS
jgi:cytosine permease